MSYQVRKYIIDRDDVADKQRKAIYKMRQEILTDGWTINLFKMLIEDHAADLIDCGKYVDADKPDDEWDLEGLDRYCMVNFGLHIPGLRTGMTVEEIKRTLAEAFEEAYSKREQGLGTDFSCKLGKAAMMNALETAWTDYISFQSEFERALSLRSCVKGDVLTDYRIESSKMFNDLLVSIRREILKGIFIYPLPEEKINSVRWVETNKKVSLEVKKLLSAL